MNLERLRTFQVVCEEGSVSRAAVRLFRSQPAISMQVAALEAEAGARLVQRTGRGVVPTAAGRRLLACAAELFRAHHRLREAWSSGEEGELRVAASDTVTRHFLPRVLRAVLARRPALALRLVESATPASLNRLHAGEVDAAFVLRPFADRRLEHEIVLRYRHVAVFRPGRAPASTRPIEPSALARGTLVLLGAGTSTRRLVDDAFRARGLAPDRVLEVGSVSIQKELVRQGLGVGIVPAYAVERRDRLHARPIAGSSLREIAIAWRRDLPPTAALSDLLAEVRAAAARRSA